MAVSPATVAASRIMSNSKTSLQNMIRHHLLPAASSKVIVSATADVQLVNDFPGSFLSLSELRPVRSPDSIEYRTTGLLAPMQFRAGLAAEDFVSQSRIEVRGRPIKIDDDFNEDLEDDDDEDDYDDDDDDDDERHLGKDSDDEDNFDDFADEEK